ncbi:MAG: LamB/YcsF family protein [Devosia sp.]|uniref:LamB/YcsF family protein n=1 Tax=Devosia sp. TaxID=1871048 RepID=UPI001A612354|nr:5-oxoprolinase subunit PxpA [Devosia sp.]MBL8597875.1 LamB/YcsF family protein [Devosia sp.]
MSWLDLNADLGEGVGDDAAMLGIVSSANVACGGHAGDADTMRATVRAARERGVIVGAHPGFADRENFGRRRLLLPPEELDASIRAQVRTLVEIAEEEGWPVRYVKLHGALANMAAEEPAVMALCLAAVEGLVQDMAVLAIDNSMQVEVAEALGYRTVREAYADRAYQPGGLLVPRQMPGAVLHDAADIAARAVRLAAAGEIVAAEGSIVHTAARSLCIHGDTPDAVAIARAVRDALASNGVEIRAAL